MRSNNLHIVFGFLFLRSIAWADYAWIPEYHHLLVKTGGDYFSSGENFGSDGVRTDLKTSGLSTTFKEYKFLAEAEYGVVEDWAATLKIPLVSNLVDTDSDTVFSGSGISDLNLGLKWNLIKRKPVLTFEISTKIPLYSTSDPLAGELVLGDGNFDLVSYVHVGYRFNKHFVAGISPGFVARFTGYENAFVLNGFLGAAWNPVYLRGVAEGYFSLNKAATSSVVAFNGVQGSGGSFARLSKNPDLVSLGGRFGVFITKRTRLEAAATWAVMGSYAPNFFRGGLSWISDFDLYTPPARKTKVKEIPFETDQQPAEKPAPADVDETTE